MQQEIKYTEVRDTISAVLGEVKKEGSEFNITSAKGRPMFLIRPVKKSERALTAVAVYIGPDKLRKNWQIIRALVMSNDQPFVLVLGKEPVALLTRHPNFHGTNQIEAFKAEYEESRVQAKVVLRTKKRTSIVAKPVRAKSGPKAVSAKGTHHAG